MPCRIIQTVGEMETFLAICIYTGEVKTFKCRRYWSSDANIRAVIDYMSCARWERIKSYIHFADNSKAPEECSPGYDELYKVRPLLSYRKSKYNMIPMYDNVFVDE